MTSISIIIISFLLCLDTSILITIYSQVWAKNADGDHLYGTVVNIDERLFAWVAFEDGSFSNEIHTQLVVVCIIKILK
jgi:hypothetical protein